MAYYEKQIFKDPKNPKKVKYNRLYVTTIGSKSDKIVNDIFGKLGMKNARVKEGMFCDGQPTRKYSFAYSDQDEVVRVNRNFKNELLNDYVDDVHVLKENRNGVFVLDKIIY